MYENKNVSALVAVGHDGSIQIVSDLNRKIPIDKLWEEAYNDAVNIYSNKEIATIKATDLLYEIGLFKTERR